MKDIKENITTFSEWDISIPSLEELDVIKKQINKIQRQRKISKKTAYGLIAFLASRINSKTYMSKLIPEGEIYIGTGKRFRPFKLPKNVKSQRYNFPLTSVNDSHIIPNVIA
mgnify:CR=1 FL=1